MKYLATIKNGQDYKEFFDPAEKYPVVGSGGEFARATKFFYDKPSVLLGRKGTIDNPIYMTTPFWTVDTMFYTIIHKNIYPKFFLLPLYSNSFCILSAWLGSAFNDTKRFVPN